MALNQPDSVIAEGKKLGPWMATALVVGNMIGSGIFLLPAALGPLQWDSVFGWILTIAGGLCVAAVFVRLTRAMPREGGPYVFTTEAFGPTVGFMVTWSYWISLWVGNAAIAVATVSYLGVFVPILSTSPPVAALTTCAMIWSVTLLNLRGARAAGGFQLATTLIKLVPLVVVILLGARALATGAASLPPLHGGSVTAGGVTTAATLSLWALLGLESATVPAGKIRDPRRTIPIATLGGTMLVGTIYLLSSSTLVLLMPTEKLASSGAPFADFVTMFWSPGPALLVAGFAAISGLGALNGWTLVQAELPYAMARDGHFPKIFATTTESGAPWGALLLSACLMTAVVLLNFSGTTAQVFRFLLLLATATSLFMYLACTLAALWLQRQGRVGRAPLLPLFAGLGAIYSVWTIYGAGGEAVAWGLVLLALGIPVHLLIRRGKENAHTA